jgi:hypothetical protein
MFHPVSSQHDLLPRATERTLAPLDVGIIDTEEIESGLATLRIRLEGNGPNTCLGQQETM